jgi:hypothetical protein
MLWNLVTSYIGRLKFGRQPVAYSGGVSYGIFKILCVLGSVRVSLFISLSRLLLLSLFVCTSTPSFFIYLFLSVAFV